MKERKEKKRKNEREDYRLKFTHENRKDVLAQRESGGLAGRKAERSKKLLLKRRQTSKRNTTIPPVNGGALFTGLTGGKSSCESRCHNHRYLLD